MILQTKNRILRIIVTSVLSLSLLAPGTVVLADDDDDEKLDGGWGVSGASWDDESDDDDNDDDDDDEDEDFLEELREIQKEQMEELMDIRKDLLKARIKLRMNPYDADALVDMAKAYAKLGLWDQVSTLVPQLEAAAADEDEAVSLLAALKLQQGDTQGALAELHAAIQAGIAGKKTYETLGLLDEQESDWYEAFLRYQNAAQLDPNDPKIIKKMGKVYRKLLKAQAKALKKSMQGKKGMPGRFGEVELDDIPVFMNGRQLQFQDVAPQIIGNRTMVPVRKLSESLGAQVDWDPVTRTVTISTPSGNTIRMTLNSNRAVVNGQPVALDVAPVIVNDRTLFPARFIAENLGGQVGWDPQYRMVTVTAPQAPAVDPAAVDPTAVDPTAVDPAVVDPTAQPDVVAPAAQ